MHTKFLQKTHLCVSFDNADLAKKKKEEESQSVPLFCVFFILFCSSSAALHRLARTSHR